MTSIAIMNAKGGVGKSTLTMAIAETLSAFHGKSVLLVDADGQMSLSLMMASGAQLMDARSANKTLVGYFARTILESEEADWSEYVMGGVSDLEEAEHLFLLPGEMDLPLLEREVAARGHLSQLRLSARAILAEAKQHVDVVLVDCAPGISVMTETWLRECDFHLVPVKPDFLAVSGLEYLQRFRSRNPEMGLASHLGVVINMVNKLSPEDRIIEGHLREESGLDCFRQTIPMAPHLQKAALYAAEHRPYVTKYAGDVGKALRALAKEIADRI
ncbi:MAG TPA: ParA family protein [Hyphomicrobiaceae bacterium]|nr:ParA family protein [Hyphomicrobiaceae bacterium]